MRRFDPDPRLQLFSYISRYYCSCDAPHLVASIHVSVESNRYSSSQVVTLRASRLLSKLFVLWMAFCPLLNVTGAQQTSSPQQSSTSNSSAPAPLQQQSAQQLATPTNPKIR